MLIYHLNSGCLEWSPTSAAIKNSLISVPIDIQEQIGMKVDQPDPRGGTTSTGSVARKALSDESNYRNCVSSVIEADYRELISLLHIYLSAILRVVSSGRRIDTNRLEIICTDADLLILDTFPWASISPTLHKLLAHSEEILRDLNSGQGLKAFSEEGSEATNKLIRKYLHRTSFQKNLF